jgi:hypothetical protein
LLSFCALFIFLFTFKNTESQPQDQPTRFCFLYSISLVTFLNMEYCTNKDSPLFPFATSAGSAASAGIARFSLFPNFRVSSFLPECLFFFPRINHCLRSSVGVKAGISVGCVPFPAPGQKQKSGIEIIYHLIEKTCQWKLAGAT